MNPLADWQTLFAVQAGAAATLTGLVFVAASINLPRIIETPGLPGRDAPLRPSVTDVYRAKECKTDHYGT
jgi:hypothetical protein